MELSKIKVEDLIFSGDIEDDRTNTYLQLNDYDWMDYNLSTRFNTEKFGIMYVKFYYYGLTDSRMDVCCKKDGKSYFSETYEYDSDIFIKYIKKYLKKHIASWESKWAFNGEDVVIEFFNDVIDSCKMI